MVCLRHIFRSNDGLDIRPPGWGNCNICIPDEKNRQCAGFVEVALLTIEIKNRKGRVKSILCKEAGNDEKRAEAKPEAETGKLAYP